MPMLVKHVKTSSVYEEHNNSVPMQNSIYFVGHKKYFSERKFGRKKINKIITCTVHSPATLLGTPVQLLGNTNC